VLRGADLRLQAVATHGCVTRQSLQLARVGARQPLQLARVGAPLCSQPRRRVVVGAGARVLCAHDGGTGGQQFPRRGIAQLRHGALVRRRHAR
jgi:hypothetical protein